MGMGGQSQKGPEMDGEDWPAAAAAHQQIATAAEISICNRDGYDDEKPYCSL